MTATTQPAIQPAGQPAGQRRIRHKRYPLMNCLSVGQKREIQRLVAAYSPDVHGPGCDPSCDPAHDPGHDPALDPVPSHDPAAVEVLLILLEVCHILDLLPGEIDHLFTPRVVKTLETWEGAVVGARRPRQVGRAWVWLPNQARPQVRRIEAGGVLRMEEE